MEDVRPDKLVPLNNSYFEQFQARLATLDPELKHVSVERLIYNLRIQFDVQSFEIISRRLIGQTILDIAEQMKLDWRYVGEVLTEAPKKVIVPTELTPIEIKLDTQESPEELEPPVKGKLVAAHTIAKIVGQRQRWTMEQLRTSDLQATPDIYRGIEIFRYDETEAVSYIRHILSERPAPAGDMMTIARMARELNKEDGWVASRVEIRFAKFRELRMDDRNRPSIHYPRWVFRTLLDEVEVLEGYPTATEADYAIMDLARELDRDQKWIEVRLLPLGIIGETKLNAYNKVPRVYYNDDDLKKLKAENEKILSYPVAGDDDATVDTLGKLTQHDKRWVVRRLPYIAVFPRTMLGSNSQPNVYYKKADAVAALNALPDDVLKTVPPVFINRPEPEDLPRLVKPQKPVDFNVRTPKKSETKSRMGDEKVTKEKLTMASKSGRIVTRAIQITGHPTAQTLISPLDDKPTLENWREFGECLQYFPEMFFPEKGESTKDAKTACGKCAVTAFCLQYALDTNQKSGVFGGLSPRERKKLQKQLT